MVMDENPFDLKGRNIIITGASSGIGRQCAVTLSQMDASIILIARREDKLRETISLMKPGPHLFFPADVTDFKNLESIVAQAVENTGRISGFIHCAGKEITIPLNMLNSKVYDDIFHVNVFSAFELIRIITNRKYIAPEASIVLMASVIALAGNSGISVYSATKGALVSAVKSLAVELAPRKIRINCISPGLIRTEMFESLYDKISPDVIEKNIAQYPLGIGVPEDVANACIYLLSDASKWVTGTNLVIDGGFTAR
jgi:NAD(P)-dependent dehydrogenase (short-subunit alcohol dehydrogenase family)